MVKAITWFRNETGTNKSIAEWMEIFNRFEINPIHRGAAGTEAMQLRLAYVWALVQHWGPENFKYEQDKSVWKRLGDKMVSTFKPEEWLKRYWQSRKPLLANQRAKELEEAMAPKRIKLLAL